MSAGIEFIDVFTAGADGIDTYRIPSLLVSPKGDLLAFCEARKDSRRDDAPKDIVMKRSRDGGRTWSGSQVVVPAPGSEGINNPCPLIEGDTIHLFCINREKYGNRQHQQLMTRSDDDGATWAEAEDMGKRFENHDPTFVPGPGVCVRMRSGRWVVPGNVRVKAAEAGVDDPEVDMVSFSIAAYSDDQGKTWRLGEKVGHVWSNESQAVELSDGSLMINCRIQNPKTERCRAVAVSKDGGETWCEHFMARDLPDPVCQGGFIRCDLPDTAQWDDPLLFSNLDSQVRGGAGRYKMTVRLSCDGGRTWPFSRLVHPGPAAYSCPAVMPDGAIGLLYECGDEDRYERLRLARFGLDWLTGGA